MASFARDRGIREGAFFLVPALSRVATRLGIECIPIGEPCQHRGKRYPFRVSVEGSLRALVDHGPVLPGMAEPETFYERFSDLDLPATAPIPLRRRAGSM
jgi:hypothetical protein